MEKYFQIFINGYQGYASYLWHEITHPHLKNYFYWLVGVSVFFFVLELVSPWRKNQAKFRKDFWLDFFYMFFNFFLFSLIIYNAASNVFVNLFNDLLAVFGITNVVAIEIGSWAVWLQLLFMFVARDFIQWWVHRLLHWSPVLWEFHKVHHSVEEMGFAAHLRYHWMETIVYRFIEYLPLAMIGFGIDDFFIVHIIGLSIGHFNHSNFTFNLGPLKYIFNNPSMHIWHHAYNIPSDRKYGINFGISLSLWDYLFGTAVIPKNGRDIRLGFPGVEKFPKYFLSQALHGFKKPKN
jgi:sterol desaturase/sphingolipid hydroxylase (fatty acid hydroxylase superfamily)